MISLYVRYSNAFFCKIHFYMVFEHQCVWVVLHNHPIMVQTHPHLFIFP